MRPSASKDRYNRIDIKEHIIKNKMIKKLNLFEKALSFCQNKYSH